MKASVKKRHSVFLALLVLLTVLAGCSGNNGNDADGSAAPAPTGTTPAASGQSASPDQLKPVTLNIMLWGDKPMQFDEVVAEFERQTKDTLNVKLNVIWTPQADYTNKLKLKLAAGEQVDLAFDAPWMSMNQFIQQDNYFNLDSYFFNDRYPGLKKAFSEQYLNNNRFFGPDNEQHIYGVPLGHYYSELAVVYYRKDLLTKYGMDDIATYDDLIAYFDNVLKHDPGLLPLVVKNDGQYGAPDVIEGNKSMTIDKAKAGIWDVPLAPNITASVYIKDGKVQGMTMTGDKLEAIAGFPEPFNKSDTSTLEAVREFHNKGYIEKEPIVRKDATGTFTSGNAAAMLETTAALDAIKGALQASVPNAELGMYVVMKLPREMQPEAAITDFRVWNFLAVPKTSKNLDRAMLFLDWIFDNQDNHDLLELGIPGKHWEPVGDDKFKYPDGIDLGQNYNLPAYQLTWNPNYIRLSANVPDEFVKYYRYMADDKSYMKSALAGFAFNGDNVKNELANPDFGNVVAQQLALRLGMVPDPVKQIADDQAKWESNANLQADIRKIKEELTAQIQAFLDAQ